jgi:feruloyl esterase
LVVRSFYGRNETKNYFTGCSNGEREALIEAQRWPEDFDGIVAMASAIQLQSLFLGFTPNNKLIFTPGGNLTPAKLAMIGTGTTRSARAAWLSHARLIEAST